MYSLAAQEADLALCRCEGGVETALQYAKMWCRYAKDLLAWMEKRISLGENSALSTISWFKVLGHVYHVVCADATLPKLLVADALCNKVHWVALPL